MIAIQQFLSVRLTLSLVHETTVVECMLEVELKGEESPVKNIIARVHFDQMNRSIRSVMFHERKSHQRVDYIPRQDELDELTNRIDEYLGR